MPKPPPPIIVCAPRSPEALAEAIDSLRVEVSERYQRREIKGAGVRTFCNWFFEDLCGLLSVHIPKGLLALGQIAWLGSSAARLEGWFSVSPGMADAYADKGCPVAVCWTNPNPGESSHIAMMRKAKTIAQAGKTNFSEGSIPKGFGNRTVTFFAHL